MSDKTVGVTLRANVSQYLAAMKSAASATGDVSKTAQADMRKLGDHMSSVGTRMSAAVTLPIVAAGGAAAKMSVDFSSAFAKMQGLAGVPAQEIDGLKKSVLSLAGETGQAPQKLADALYEAASAGLTASQAMDAVEVAAKGAAAGMGSAQDIVGLAASATAAYGSGVMDAAKATDILTQTIREGRADPDELAGSLGRVLPVAAQMGVAFEEVGGAVAYLTNVFGDTDRAVTGLNDMLVKLSTPADAAKQILTNMGTSAAELKTAIAEDGLTGALELLRDHGFAGNSEAIRALAPDMQGAAALMTLLNDEAGTLDETIGNVTHSTGALGDAFNIAAQEDGFAMKQAWAELQIAMIQAGDVIVPVLADIMGVVGDMAGVFTDLPGPVQDAVLALLGLAAAAGPILILVGNLLKLRAALIGVSAAGAIAGGTGGTGLGGLAGGLSALMSSGALPYVAAVAATAAGGYVAYQVVDAVMGGGPTDYSEGERRARDVYLGRAEAQGDPTAIATQQSRRLRREMLLGTGDVGFGGVDPWNTGPRRRAPVRVNNGPMGLGVPFNPNSVAGTSMGAMAEAERDAAAVSRQAQATDEFTRSINANLAAVAQRSNMYERDTAELIRGREAVQAYSDALRSTDWGTADLAGATTAMSGYTSQLFGMTNIAAASEAAFDNLDATFEKNGFTLDVATEKGRENQAALQELAATLDTQFVAAYTNANGSLDTFMASATELGDKTLARLQDELGLTDAQTEELGKTLGLTATDYEARFNLAGDEEARVRLELLSGVVGLLQDDVQREVAMKIATGDFQGALDLVQSNIAETPRSRTVEFNAIDNISWKAAAINAAIGGIQGKTITLNQRTVYSTVGTPRAFARGGTVGAEGGIGGEAGLEHVQIGQFSALINNPTWLPPGAVVTPLSGAGGTGSGYAGGSSSKAASAPNLTIVNNRRDLSAADLEVAIRQATFV